MPQTSQSFFTGDLHSPVEIVMDHAASPHQKIIATNTWSDRPPGDLSEARVLIECGELRLAIDQLLRSEQIDAMSERPRSESALLLTECYARVGLHNDATEWLAAAQRRSARDDGEESMSAFDATHVTILHWHGQEVNAIRIANAALGRHSRRATDPQRLKLLAVLGGAYLRLGQAEKAQQCVDAMQATHAGESIGGRCAGFMLSGEIRLWTIVRQRPAFRAQVLISEEIAVPALQRRDLVAEAIDAYGLAFQAAAPGSLERRHADIGLARASVAGRADGASWTKIEAHIGWLNARGLCRERDATRLHLGMLLLLHKRALDARRWLIPLADSALVTPGLPLEHDALYFASVACSESGNDRAALMYLNRYNVRIREQHLSRVTVPPPNLDRSGDALPLQQHGRRRGESDREVVDHVVERLRLAPQARFDSRQLAQLAGVSRRTLEKDFRRVTGLAPKEFTTRLRLAVFERRLAILDQPTPVQVDALARGVGFSSYRSLARCAGRVPPMDEDGAAFLASVLP